MAVAQLAIQRSGQLDWLRRPPHQPCQLWTIDRGSDGFARRGAPVEAPEGSWFCAEPDGRTTLALPPPPEQQSAPPPEQQSAPLPAPLAAALRHPRSGAWFLAEAQALIDPVRGLRHPLAVVAMTLSADLHRLYAVTTAGELYVLTASAYRELVGEPALDAPELLLGGLAEHGAPSSLALGPAGLLLATSRAVVGINLRSLRLAPIIAELAAHPLLAELRSPAVAMDHHRNLYLADEALAVCAPAHGTPPLVCARAR